MKETSEVSLLEEPVSATRPPMLIASQTKVGEREDKERHEDATVDVE